MKTSILLFLISFGILGATSCSRMDATYADFIKDGKIIYPGKADSVSVLPGKNRLLLSWLLFDPNVTRVKIYWDNRTDSVELNVAPSAGIDSMKTLLSGLEERDYLFEYFTYDEDGNQSVKVEAQGHAYGDLYTNSLLNRPIQRVEIVNDTTRIYWGESSDSGLIGTSVEYADTQNQIRTVFADAEVSATPLPERKPNTDLRYRTVFLPHPMAIDTFYTAYETIPFN